MQILFKIASLTVSYKFHVLEQAKQPIILSIHFLTAQKTKIDLDSNTFVLHDGLAEEVMGKPGPTALVSKG